MRKWNSISKSLAKEDLMMEFNEISAKDEFVDSWSDSTKGKVASAYLTILRKVGMLTNENRLHSLACNNYDYYLAMVFGSLPPAAIRNRKHKEIYVI